MESKQIDKTNPECRRVGEEYERLWGDKKFLDAAKLWEDNGYLEMAAKVYEHIAGFHAKQNYPSIENIREQSETWFKAEGIWKILGDQSRALKCQKQGIESRIESELAENRENPRYPSPKDVFKRISQVEESGKRYVSDDVVKELLATGFGFQQRDLEYRDHKDKGLIFRLEGALIGRPIWGLFDRKLKTDAWIERYPDEIIAGTYATNQLSLDGIECIFPDIFGSPDKIYSTNCTNNAIWTPKLF